MPAASLSVIHRVHTVRRTASVAATLPDVGLYARRTARRNTAAHPRFSVYLRRPVHSHFRHDVPIGIDLHREGLRRNQFGEVESPTTSPIEDHRMVNHFAIQGAERERDVSLRGLGVDQQECMERPVGVALREMPASGILRGTGGHMRTLPRTVLETPVHGALDNDRVPLPHIYPVGEIAIRH